MVSFSLGPNPSEYIRLYINNDGNKEISFTKRDLNLVLLEWKAVLINKL
jgi:hypothetical protein